MNTSAAPTYVSGTKARVELGGRQRQVRRSAPSSSRSVAAALARARHRLADERCALGLADPLGEREDEPLRHDQAARGGEVGLACARGATCRPASTSAMFAAAPPAAASDARDGLPLGLPRAGGAFVLLHEAAGQQAGGGLRPARAGQRERSIRPGCACAASSRIRRGPRRPARAPRRPRSGPSARRRARSCRARRPAIASADPSAATRTREVCQGSAGSASPSSPATRGHDLGPVLAERRERAGRAAELRPPAGRAASSTRRCASSTPASQVAALRPNVVGSACCSSVRATMGVARCVVGEPRAGRGHGGDVGQHELERAAADEHRRGVDDVLARRAVVHVARRLAPDGGAQRAHERLGRIARRRALARDALGVEQLGAAGGGDRLGRRGGNHARARPRPAPARARSRASPAARRGRPARRAARCGAKIASNTSDPLEADVVLGQRRRGRVRGDDVAQLRELQLLLERIAARASGAASRSSTTRSARRARRAAGRSPSRRRAARVAAGRVPAARAPRPARARRRSRGSGPWRRSAARCARRRRPGTGGRSCIGSATKLRMPRDALLEDRPLVRASSRRAPSRGCSSSQMRSSGHSSMSSSGRHCR